MKVYHFMRYKWWFLGSLTVVTIFAIVLVFIVGLDLGIDFKGGWRMEFALEQSASVDDIRALVEGVGVNEPVVQSIGAAATGTTFMITAQTMDQSEIDQVKTALESTFGLDESKTAVDQVGASFSEHTTRLAFIAVAIAVVAIIAYLSFRFNYKFAIPAILALIHDVGLTLGIYAATNRLVTTATVAAVLTILGYSVHDTIIVFDRMRENTLFMKRETYGDMVDLSIRQTMVRSINTTIAILLPLLAILIFGGPTLKDFAMALTIGVVSGTYSSFFVAAPLVTLWKEREPMYRKRLAVAGAAGMVAITDTATSDGKASAGEDNRAVSQPRPKPKSSQAVQTRSRQKGTGGSGSGKKTSKSKRKKSRR